MSWLKTNWRLMTINLFGLSVLIALIVATDNYGGMGARFTPFFEGCGLWAVRFLLFCLAMSPMNTYLGWRGAIKLRKTAGLWAFGFATIHFLYYILDTRIALQDFFNATYYILGGLGLTILSLLAVTSNRWAMKRLGKSWKRLHRLVYIAGIAVTLHAILAYSNSKKFYLDPVLKTELNVYLAVMVILLVLRLSFVRGLVKPRRRSASRVAAAQ